MAYGSGKTHSYFPALRVMESPVSYPELAPETRWILQKPTYSSETPLLYEEVSFTAAVPSLCYGTSHGKAKKPMSWPRDQKRLPHHNGYVLMHWVGRKCERCAYWTFTSASEHQKKHTVVKPTSGLPCSLLLPPARGWGGGQASQNADRSVARVACPMGTCKLPAQDGHQMPLQERPAPRGSAFRANDRSVITVPISTWSQGFHSSSILETNARYRGQGVALRGDNTKVSSRAGTPGAHRVLP